MRGEYPPYVKSYLKKNKMFPKTKPDDEVELKKSKPDFIGVNYYFSICVEEKKRNSQLSTATVLDFR